MDVLNELRDGCGSPSPALKSLVNENVKQPKVVVTVRGIVQVKEPRHRTLMIDAVWLHRLAAGSNIGFGPERWPPRASRWP